MRRSFCEITGWWNWHYIRNQISPHFFYYPVQLMIEKGFDVEILTALYPERGEARHEIHENLQINRFAKENLFPFGTRLLSHMMKKDYSLIHLHTIDWLVDYVPWIVSRIKNIPMIFTSHRHDLLEPLLESESKMSLMRKKTLKNVFMVRDSRTCVFIAFTRSQAESYKKLGIKNIRIIPHGIDPAAFQIEPDNKINEKYGLEEFNILCVGTIEPRKGQLLLIKIMPRILREFPHTKLLLLGRTYAEYQKEHLRTLRSHVNKMSLNDKVVFLNDVAKNELIQLYLSSSMFVLPTEAEMFGLIFLEAMASGLPIISTNKPHIRELLGNGEAGILVDRDQKAIEDAIIRLLEDSALRRRLGNNGKRVVEREYRLDKVIQQHWDLYRSLLKQHR